MEQTDLGWTGVASLTRVPFQLQCGITQCAERLHWQNPAFSITVPCTQGHIAQLCSSEVLTDWGSSCFDRQGFSKSTLTANATQRASVAVISESGWGVESGREAGIFFKFRSIFRKAIKIK